MGYPGSKSRITVIHDLDNTTDLVSKYITDVRSKEAQVDKLVRLVEEIGSAVRNGSIDLQVDDGNEVAATGTFTFSAQATANDTVLINGVTFTAVASGATGNQWNVGASATATAANLAAAINASATALVNTTVTASPAVGVVTISALKKGTMGNAVTIAKGTDAGSVDTVSGARLTGGLEPTNISSAATYKHGV